MLSHYIVIHIADTLLTLLNTAVNMCTSLSFSDANRDAEASPSRAKFEDLDFDSLLKQAQRGLKT